MPSQVADRNRLVQLKQANIGLLRYFFGFLLVRHVSQHEVDQRPIVLTEKPRNFLRTRLSIRTADIRLGRIAAFRIISSLGAQTRFLVRSSAYSITVNRVNGGKRKFIAHPSR